MNPNSFYMPVQDGNPQRVRIFSLGPSNCCWAA